MLFTKEGEMKGYIIKFSVINIVLLALLIVSTTFGCTYLKNISGKSDATQSAGSKLEKYWYYKGNTLQAVDLQTVKKWTGSSQSREINYHADKAPWILNAMFTQKSQLSSVYDVQLEQKTQIEGVTLTIPIQRHVNEFSALVNDTGDFIIIIQASGVDWWVRVGTE